MSLLDTAERFASIDRSQVVLDRNQCLHARDQSSSCAACFDICPVNAITPGNPPALITETCQTCLACLPACPVGAFHADDDVSSLLNCVAHLEEKTIELVCGHHTQPETSAIAEGVRIQIGACLAGLGSGAYLNLAALGVENIILRTDACRACKWAGLKVLVERQAQQANLFVAVWNKSDMITFQEKVTSAVERPVWNAKNPPLSRRDLFRMLGRQGQVAMARAMEKGVTASKRQPGRDRIRLLSAVSHLPTPASEMSIILEDFGFASLEISDACTACGTCAKTCPTEALRFEMNHAETEFKLSFFAQLCIGCELCAHVCAPDAILIGTEPSFSQVFSSREAKLVRAGGLIRCEHCGSLMAAMDGASLCPLCQYRRANPFGSMLLPGSKKSLPKPGKDIPV